MEATVAERGQITLPKSVRDALGLSKGTSSEYLAHLFLMVNGMEPSDVTIKDLPPEQLLKSLQSGAVDAACLWHPNLQSAIDALGERGTAFQSDVVYIWTLSLIGRKDFLEANPAATRAIVRALLTAQDDYESGEDRILQMIADVNATPLGWVKNNSRNLILGVSLNQSAISVLDDNLRWEARIKKRHPKTVPNPLDYVYWDALESERPEAVTIIRTTSR